MFKKVSSGGMLRIKKEHPSADRQTAGRDTLRNTRDDCLKRLHVLERFSFAVTVGRNAHHLLEGGAEIMLAFVTDPFRDLVHGHIGRVQQLDRFPDPGLRQEAYKRRSQLFFEQLSSNTPGTLAGWMQKSPASVPARSYCSWISCLALRTSGDSCASRKTASRQAS